MAHELEMNEATGTGSMFYRKAGGTPWHNWGFQVPDDAPLTSEHAVTLAKADWDAVLRPFFISDGNGGMVESPVGRALVRSDKGSTLAEAADVIAAVGRDYCPMQHRTVFGVFDPLIEAGVVRIETGGTVRDGRDAWLLVQFVINDPVVSEVFGTEVVPFGLATNNHGGMHNAEVALVDIRPVCWNTLQAARSRMNSANSIKIPHRGDANTRLVDAATTLFGGIVERYRMIAADYQAMRDTFITVEQFTKSVLDTAAPLPGKVFTVDGDHLTSRGFDAAMEAAEARRTAITRAWHGGKGHKGDGSVWEAYNGAVEVMDHDTELFRTRGSRVASMLGGRLADRKAMVQHAVMALVKR